MLSRTNFGQMKRTERFSTTFLLLLIVLPLVSSSSPVETTIRSDNLEEFEKVLRIVFKSDVNAIADPSKQSTLLHLACLYGSQDIASHLLKANGIKINAKNLVGETPLHLACLSGKPDIVKSIIDKASNLVEAVEAVESANKQTPIFYAARSTGTPEDLRSVVKHLLGVGQANYQHRDVNGMEAIHVAVINRQFSVVSELAKGDPHRPCCGSGVAKTISHLAAEYNVVDFLDNSLFNATQLDGLGQNAACWAAIKGSLKFGGKMADDKKIPINDGKCVYHGGVQGTPLQAAAYYRHRDYIRLLLESAKELVDESGSGSPIHAMALKKSGIAALDNEILTMIANKNRQIINSFDSEGRTPFLTAIKSSNVEFAKELRNKGAAVTARDRFGNSAVQLAEDAETFEYLRTIKNPEIDQELLKVTVFPTSVPTETNEGCGPLPKITNGALTKIPQELPIGAKIAFSCNAGWRPEGAGQVECNTEGQWVILGQCARYGCEQLPAIPNVLLSKNILPFQEVGTKLIFSCNPGFRVNGSDELFCTIDGKWAVNGQCFKYGCAQLPTIPNGGLNQKPKQQFQNVGTKLSFFCNSGFRFQGTPQVECGSDAEWITKGECVERGCDQPPKIANGIIALEPDQFHSVGSKISFACNDGFRVQGSDEITCLKNYRWQTNGQCVKYGCAQLPKISNGALVGRPQPFQRVGAQLLISCKSGFRLEGTGYVECSDEAKWGSESQCVKEGCDQLPVISNGALIRSSNAFQTPGTKLTFSCNEGFGLEGAGQVQCNSDGTWTTNGEDCIQQGCNQLPKITNGALVGDPEQFQVVGAKISFACNDGFRLQGSEEVVCRSTDRWQTTGQCVRHGCTQLPKISNGALNGRPQQFQPVGTKLSYSCNRGFQILGAGHVECNNEAKWAVHGQCVREGCDQLPNIENGGLLKNPEQFQVVGTKLSFSCNPVFQLEGSSELECSSDRQWLIKGHCVVQLPSAPEVTVNPVVTQGCNQMPEVRNGVVSGWMSKLQKIGSRLSFSCNAGHRVEGSPYVECSPDATWTAKGQCELQDSDPLPGCTNLPSIANALLMGRPAEFQPAGATLKFTCSSGYKMQGDHYVECGTDGTWLVKGSCKLATEPTGAFDLRKQIAFFEASYSGKTKLVETLLASRQVDVNGKYVKSIHGKIGKQSWADGETALINAAFKGHSGVVDLLLKKDAKVNEKGPNGNTALIWAARKGFREIVELVLRKGANVNGKNEAGETALSLATSKGHQEVVSLLTRARE